MNKENWRDWKILAATQHHLLKTHASSNGSAICTPQKMINKYYSPMSSPVRILKEKHNSSKKQTIPLSTEKTVCVTTSKRNVWGLGKRNCKAYWNEERLEVTVLHSLIRLAEGSNHFYQFFSVRLPSFSLQSSITWEGIMFPRLAESCILCCNLLEQWLCASGRISQAKCLVSGNSSFTPTFA